MAPKKITVKPGKEQSKISFYVSIIFVGIGFFIVIPIFGLFGILWTAIAGFGVYESYRNGFTEEGMPSYEIDIDTKDIETRLKKVEQLYNNGVITKEEYDSRRDEILNEI